MKAFDRKFGAEFIAALPTAPGVYRIFDEAGKLIYVGKAKNLRRRLSQYRNAKRRKAHLKMREIVSHAERIEIETCATELAALLLEERLIREHRPRWNVAGSFSFLYPMIGLKRVGADLFFIYTTAPHELPAGLELHGSFRSRQIAGEAFFALMRLMKYVGHGYSPKQAQALFEKHAVSSSGRSIGANVASPSTVGTNVSSLHSGGVSDETIGQKETFRRGQRQRKRQRGKHSYIFAFRKLPDETLAHWSAFFRGEAPDALAQLSLALLENASACGDAGDVQDDLRAVRRFWRNEVQRLARAIRRTSYTEYPVAQSERDALFLRYKFSFRTETAHVENPPA